MREQRAPVRPPLGDARPRLGRCGLLETGVLGRRDLLGLFKSKEELILRQALGAAAEAVTLQGLDDQAQPLGIGALLHQQRLERAGVVREGRSRGGHEAD